MKNKYIIIILIILLLILNLFLVFKKNTSVIEKSKINKIERKEFNIYLQQSVGSEEYDPSTNTMFPNQGYLLNTTKTMCYDYNGKETSYKPEQNLVNEIIDGSITIESSKTTYCNLYFDKDETPIITTFNVKGKTSSNQELNNGFTYQTDSLPFNIEYTDTESDVKQYCISGTESVSDCIWQTLSGTSGTYTLINKTDGLTTLHIYLKDKANNISEVKQDTITVDKTKPVITSFTLTGTPDSDQTLSNSAQYTHTKDITYNANITEENIESYCVYEENNSCNYNNSTSTTITNQSYTLANETEGNHTINIKVKDKAGNESVIDANSTKTITLDLQNPTATIEGKSATTDIITVIIGYTGNDISGIIERQCKISNQNTWTDAEEDGSCTIDKLSDGQELKDGTAYTIEARVRDGSGRYSQSPYPSQTITTKAKPAGDQIIEKNPAGLSETDIGGMRRFVGQCKARNNGCDNKVDNFVCFGYTNESDCKNEIANNDYIYRIIGITSDGKVKLIKNGQSIPKVTQWTSNDTNNVKWKDSELFSKINGTGFLTNLSDDWQEKMALTTWLYGDMGYTEENKYIADNTADEIYKIETGQAESYSGYYSQGYKVGKWTDKVAAKVGLMYLSDLYYSYNGDGTTNCFLSSAGCVNSWMEIKNCGGSVANTSAYDEWTMVRHGLDGVHYKVNGIFDGRPGASGMTNSVMSTRPVFYLDPSVLITSGTGTSTDPFIVEK